MYSCEIFWKGYNKWHFPAYNIYFLTWNASAFVNQGVKIVKNSLNNIKEYSEGTRAFFHGLWC